MNEKIKHMISFFITRHLKLISICLIATSVMFLWFLPTFFFLLIIRQVDAVDALTTFAGESHWFIFSSFFTSITSVPIGTVILIVGIFLLRKTRHSKD